MNRVIAFEEAVALLQLKTGISNARALVETLPSADDNITRVAPGGLNFYVGNVGNVRFVHSQHLDELICRLKGADETGPRFRQVGGQEKADWEAYREAFIVEVRTRGFPDKLNVKGWRTVADVKRWLADRVEQDGAEPLSEATLARQARKMMDASCRS